MNASVMRTGNRKPRELNQGGTSTSAIVFSEDGTNPVILRLPDAGELTGGTGTSGRSAQFKVRAWGRVTGGTTTNYTATLQFGTSLTSGSNTTIEASSAVAVNSESENWCIEVDLTWDDVSEKINGRGWAQVANSVDAYAALDNQITSADGTGNESQGFVVAGTFSSGNASNTAHLDGFQLIY